MLPHYLVQTLTYGQKRSNYNDKLQGIVATGIVALSDSFEFIGAI